MTPRTAPVGSPLEFEGAEAHGRRGTDRTSRPPAGAFGRAWSSALRRGVGRRIGSGNGRRRLGILRRPRGSTGRRRGCVRRLGSCGLGGHTRFRRRRKFHFLAWVLGIGKHQRALLPAARRRPGQSDEYQDGRRFHRPIIPVETVHYACPRSAHRNFWRRSPVGRCSSQNWRNR